MRALAGWNGASTYPPQLGPRSVCCRPGFGGAGRQVGKGVPGDLPGSPRAWDCVNPRLLALLLWAEQVMGLESVRGQLVETGL